MCSTLLPEDQLSWVTALTPGANQCFDPSKSATWKPNTGPNGSANYYENIFRVQYVPGNATVAFGGVTAESLNVGLATNISIMDTWGATGHLGLSYQDPESRGDMPSKLHRPLYESDADLNSCRTSHHLLYDGTEFAAKSHRFMRFPATGNHRRIGDGWRSG